MCIRYNVCGMCNEVTGQLLKTCVVAHSSRSATWRYVSDSVSCGGPWMRHWTAHIVARRQKSRETSPHFELPHLDPAHVYRRAIVYNLNKINSNARLVGTLLSPTTSHVDRFCTSAPFPSPSPDSVTVTLPPYISLYGIVRSPKRRCHRNVPLSELARTREQAWERERKRDRSSL